ncbi:MAG: GAF domain-containing protein, partial [Anaerolineae bacterium]
LFAEVETALADARAAQESYITRAWQETGAASQERQHFYARPDAPPLRDDEIAVAQQLALTQPGPAAVTLNGDAAGSKTIAAPVTVGGKPIGTFQLHRRAEGGDASPWTDDDLSLVETVLEQVAQTAENLRLFEETRERAGREQTIREITDKLRAATDLNTLLETAARELGQRLNMPHTVLELGTDSSSPVADHRRQQQAEQP